MLANLLEITWVIKGNGNGGKFRRWYSYYQNFINQIKKLRSLF